MTVLTVGSAKEYSNIEAAVAASSSGDTVAVDAGAYTNDFVTISHSLTLQAVGGTVSIVAMQAPPNGKAIIDEGGSGVTVSISGFDLSGAAVSSGNGAGIRYEGGALTLTNVNIHDNQEGLLGAADPAGTITINASTFANNGAGDGRTHNIYIGNIQAATIENSTITSANVGHDIKSRAANTTITGNTITDGASGTASYEIDLPNGGNGVITGNTIEKGPNASNPIAITSGEEGNIYASSSLLVQGNTLLNDYTSHITTVVVNDTPATAVVTGNQLYGWNTASSGPANASGNTVLTTEPAVGNGASASAGSASSPAPVSMGSGPDVLDLSVSEDSWQGDAQFTVTINGQTIGGAYVATASHAAGATQDIAIAGNWGTGPKTVGVSFINDAYGGTAATDRNLYVNGVTYDGQAAPGTPVALFSNGTASFTTPGQSAAVTVNLAEDAWQGDAQYSIMVDGKTVGSSGTVTALNAQGRSQAVNLQAALSAGTHDVAVSFLNDAWGGTPSTDRNLYVKSIAVNGSVAANSSAALYSAGTQHFQIVVPSS